MSSLDTKCREILEYLKQIRPNKVSLGMTITLWAHPNSNNLEFRASIVEGNAVTAITRDNSENVIHDTIIKWYEQC